MPEREEMKSPTSSQGTVLFCGLLNLSLSLGSSAEHKKRDKMLDGKPASGIVAWSL
jgi:hypothetical protein